MGEQELLETKGGLGRVRRKLTPLRPPPLAERARVSKLDGITVSPEAMAKTVTPICA